MEEKLKIIVIKVIKMGKNVYLYNKFLMFYIHGTLYIFHIDYEKFNVVFIAGLFSRMFVMSWACWGIRNIQLFTSDFRQTEFLILLDEFGLCATIWRLTW